MDAIRRIPGVEAAGAVDFMPLASGSMMTSARSGGDRISLNMRTFVPGYFEAMRSGESSRGRGLLPREVVGTMLRDAMWPVGIGMAIGIGAATASTKVIASFLFETQATEPATFAAVAAVVGVSGCVAAWIPARRAAAVGSVRALRAE